MFLASTPTSSCQPGQAQSTSRNVERDNAFFNSKAADWDNNNKLSTPEIIGRLLELTPVNPGSSILDVGCGTGVLLPYLSDLTGPTGRITAVDRASEMLRRAHDRASALDTPVACLLCDIESDILADRFDLIVLYCVLPHLSDPVSTIVKLKENNLNPNGRILIAHPASREAINSIHHDCEVSSTPLPEGQELRRRLRRAGLNVSVVVDTDEAYAIVVEWTAI